MACSKAVSLAIIIHLILRCTVFVEYQDCHSNWTKVSSFIILASCILFLLDLEIIPNRYKRNVASFNFISLFAETTIALLLIEVFMIIIWMKLELFIVIFIRAILGDIKSFWTRKVVNLIVIMISITFFIYAAFVTNRLDQLMNQFKLLLIQIKDYGLELIKNTPFMVHSQQNSQIRSGQCVVVPCSRLGISPDMCSQFPNEDNDDGLSVTLPVSANRPRSLSRSRIARPPARYRSS